MHNIHHLANKHSSNIEQLVGSFLQEVHWLKLLGVNVSFHILQYTYLEPGI